MIEKISFTLNSKPVTMEVDGDRELLWVLRTDLGLTGTKYGCGEGLCGACTVLIDGLPIDACIYLAIWADGRSIRTVEGESRNHKLSSVQQAFVNEGAVQCGICTPGFVMAATAFVEKHRNQKVSRDEIRRGLAGNLCRCTGYEAIVTAVQKCLDDDDD